MTETGNFNDDDEDDLEQLFSASAETEESEEEGLDPESDTQNSVEDNHVLKPENRAGELDEDSGDEEVERSHGSRFSTGVETLDRELAGGIPPGRMVAFVAPPDTQSELLVKELATTRDTLYISTFRPKWEIEEELRDFITVTNDPDRLSTQVTVEHVSPETLLTEPERYIDQLESGSNLIIDSINEFELENRSQYVGFLNTVKQQLWDTGSIGLFYGMKDDGSPISRSLTLKRADIVWRLRMSIEPQGITNYLVISKFRGGEALTEPIKLILTDDVKIDTSRDIA